MNIDGGMLGRGSRFGNILSRKVTPIIDGGSIWLWKVADKVLRDTFSILTIIGVVLRKKT